MIFVRMVNILVCFSPSSVFLIPIGMHVKREAWWFGLVCFLGKIPFPNFQNVAWYLRQYDSHWV